VPFHKAASSRKIIESKGAKILFLPPYSPDFNPIENDFGNIKKIREYNEDRSLDQIVAAYQ